MAEQDPRDYRGGVHEPPDTKGGTQTWADNEGVVPREMIDDPPPQEGADDQTLGDGVLGEVTDKDPSDDSLIDTSGGDDADATSQGTTGSTADSGRSQWNAASSAPADGGA